MSRPGSLPGRALWCLVLAWLVAAPMYAAGFAIYEHGAKAMGMAGAFTAQADDPSAIFHNVAGIAFQEERKFAVGFTYITSAKAEFKGSNPFPGEGTTAEQEKLSEFPPHFYYVQPVKKGWTFGFGIYAPFGLTTEWKDKDDFAGRFISTKAALQVFDLAPNIAFKVGDKLGIGFGAFVRMSTVELHRRQGVINPFTLQPADVADVVLESDMNEGYGWQVGFLHKYNNSFSWGASYRSKVKVDYTGDASLTQILTGNPQFDFAVSQQLPFGTKVPMESGIEYPDMASLGFAFALSQNWLVEADFNWVGWSSFQSIDLHFPTAELPDLSIPEGYDDANNYRLGVKWMRGGNSEWRFGYVYDETPQPDESVSPLLPDANRNGFTVGYGRQMQRMTWDLALMYLPFDERTTEVNHDNYNGTYNTSAYLFGVTVGW